MSAAAQTEIAFAPRTKAKKTPIGRVVCKCGHHQDVHANRVHTGARMRALGLTRSA